MNDSRRLIPQLSITAWMQRSLTAIGILVALAGAIAYLVIALQYRNEPFLGLFLNRDLEVLPHQPFTDEVWPGFELGIDPGDKIIGAEGVDEFPANEPYKSLDAIMEEFDSGDSISLRVARDASLGTGIAQADSCLLNSTQTLNICRVTVTLSTMPWVDFVAYFGVGFAAGVVALFISILLFIRRANLTSARFFALIGAMLAWVEMGHLNLVAIHDPTLVFMWWFGASMLGALMISFSMMFPANMAVIERLPAMRYAPLLGGLVVAVLGYGIYQNGEELTSVFFLALLTGVGVMMAVMAWRWQYTQSPIFHEQAAYVFLGTLFGLAPTIIWALAQLLTDGELPAWWLLLTQILGLLFIFSVSYAIVEERLLETDRLVPTVAVYGFLSGALVMSYAIVVFGLSVIGVQFADSNSPVFIAGVVLVVALAFVPIRTRLNDNINEIWFRRRRQYEQRIAGLMNNLTDAINLNDVDGAVRSELEGTVAPTETMIFVRDKEAQAFRATDDPTTGRAITDVTFAFDSGLSQYLENDASVIYLEVGQALPPRLIQDRAQLAVLNTPVIVRLMGRQQLNGFLALSARRNGERYAYGDLQFIERIADQAALALERTQIVEDLEHRFRVQDVLSQVSRALSYAIDLDTLMELLYAQTSRVIETDIFSIAIVETNATQLRYAFFVEGDERLEHLEGRRWSLGNDLISDVATKQSLIRTNDYVKTLRQRFPNAEVVHPNVKAWIGAPLTADTAAGTLGVMTVGTTDPTIRYSDEQIQLFLDIASIAASAINKTQLFDAARTRTQQLEVLNEISNQLSTAVADLDHLLDLITRSAMDILRCEAGSLLLQDAETEDMVFQVALGPGAQELVGQRIPINTPSLATEALKSAESVIVNDTTTDHRWHGEVLSSDNPDDSVDRAFHSRAILTTPLLAQGEPIGVLQVINKRDGSPFAPDDATMLTTFAAQAAVAIQNARLYALQDERLIQRVDELEGLAAIDQSLNQTLELTKVVGITLDWAVRQSGAKAGALAMMVPDQDDALRLIASKGYPDDSRFAETKVGTEFPMKQGIWGRVIRTGTPAFTRNLAEDPDYVETLSGAVVQIIIPIVSVQEVIGVVIVESDNETDLTLVDMEFLTRLADHASPAITNAQLFDELRHQQEARTQFVSFIAHELKNPMTSMKGYTDLLMRGVVGPLNEQQSGFLETIFTNVNRLEALINDLRDVEAQDAGQLKLVMGAVDFSQIIRESLRSLQQVFERKEQEVIHEFKDDLPQVWGDRVRLVQIMLNFLTNANKYTPANGKVWVKVEATVNIWDPEGVRRVLHVQIQDTGIGMAEEDLQKIFKQKYFRTDTARASDEPGTGLGMVLTHGLILQHGGQVWVESTPGEGSTFHFTLPLADEIMREAT